MGTKTIVIPEYDSDTDNDDAPLCAHDCPFFESDDFSCVIDAQKECDVPDPAKCPGPGDYMLVPLGRDEGNE